MGTCRKAKLSRSLWLGSRMVRLLRRRSKPSSAFALRGRSRIGSPRPMQRLLKKMATIYSGHCKKTVNHPAIKGRSFLRNAKGHRGDGSDGWRTLDSRRVAKRPGVGTR